MPLVRERIQLRLVYVCGWMLELCGRVHVCMWARVQERDTNSERMPLFRLEPPEPAEEEEEEEEAVEE